MVPSQAELDMGGQEVIGGRYRKTKFLGKGAQGSVWECQDLYTGDRYACKSFPVRVSLMKEFDAEVRALRKLTGHKNVVKLVDVLSTGNEVHVIMELVKGGDLLSEVLQNGPLREEKACMLFRQLVEAVAYCHSSGVIHRDIKPDNVLLQREEPEERTQHTREGTPARGYEYDYESGRHSRSSEPCPQLPHRDGSMGRRGGDSSAQSLHFSRIRSSLPHPQNQPERPRTRVKLVDFALSEVVGKDGVRDISGSKAEVVGTKQYMAPEVRSGTYDLKADVYSLGVTLFAVLTGRLPALDQKTQLPMKIDFTSSHLKGVSREAVDLLKNMLTGEPSERLSVFEVLEHPWLNPRQHKKSAVLAQPLKAAWTWIEAF